MNVDKTRVVGGTWQRSSPKQGEEAEEEEERQREKYANRGRDGVGRWFMELRGGNEGPRRTILRVTHCAGAARQMAVVTLNGVPQGREGEGGEGRHLNDLLRNTVAP